MDKAGVEPFQNIKSLELLGTAFASRKEPTITTGLNLKNPNHW